MGWFTRKRDKTPDEFLAGVAKGDASPHVEEFDAWGCLTVAVLGFCGLIVARIAFHLALRLLFGFLGLGGLALLLAYLFFRGATDDERWAGMPRLRADGDRVCELLSEAEMYLQLREVEGLMERIAASQERAAATQRAMAECEAASRKVEAELAAVAGESAEAAPRRAQLTASRDEWRARSAGHRAYLEGQGRALAAAAAVIAELRARLETGGARGADDAVHAAVIRANAAAPSGVEPPPPGVVQGS